MRPQRRDMASHHQVGVDSFRYMIKVNNACVKIRSWRNEIVEAKGKERDLACLNIGTGEVLESRV